MHVTIEINEQDGKCGTCGRETILLVDLCEWKLTDANDEYSDTVEVKEEVTAHYCTTCSKVTSFFINI